ncbi:MAG: tRNA (adenosine(37)-N6)-threonylcarbamoyltransferase complex dimerization subunit type 1 TsaB [Clostridia bacterium]|nr:tRNA (adenosine(37)-N6)-threonylcarbamoyltransferase complex dimerization subunit type 1 TsaB [Clostridia bacterium]
MKLCIDTCTNVCSVSVIEKDKIIGERTYNDKLRHSEILMVEIDEMIKKLDRTPSDIDEVFVTSGPGSFTGIRIGVTAANTLADTLGVKVNGYTVLDLIAGNFMCHEGHICSMVYARNERYYFAIYEAKKGTLKLKTSYDVKTIDEILKLAKKYKHLIFAGDLNDSHIEAMNKRGLVASKGLGMPRSAMLPYLNIENKDKLGREEMIDGKYVKPVYLEKSQAEKMKK